MLLANQPRSFGELVSDIYGFFKPLFPKLFTIMLLKIVCFIALGILAAVIMIPVAMSGSGALALLIGIIISIAFILFAAYFLAAQFIRGFGVLKEDQTIIDQTWSQAKQRYKSVALAMVCIFLVMLGLMIGISLLIGIAGAIMGVLGLIVTLLGAILTIYVLVRLCLWPPICIVQDYGALDSLGRSYRLVKDNWWKVFGLFFFGVGIPAIGFFALQMLVALSFPAQLTMEGGDAVVSAGAVFGAGSVISFCITIVQYFIMPVMTVATLLVTMNDLNLREHHDISTPETSEAEDSAPTEKL